MSKPPNIQPYATRPDGPERPQHRGPHGGYGYGPTHVVMIDDPDTLAPLVGDWAEVVLRIVHGSPEHWEALTLMLIGLSGQVVELTEKVDELQASLQLQREGGA